MVVFWLHLCFVFVFLAVFWLCLVFYVCVLVTSCVLCLSFFRHQQNHSIMRCFPVQFLVDQQLQWCCTISLSRQKELIQESNQSYSLISKLIWIRLIIELIQESNLVKVRFLNMETFQNVFAVNMNRVRIDIGLHFTSALPWYWI